MYFCALVDDDLGELTPAFEVADNNEGMDSGELIAICFVSTPHLTPAPGRRF